MKRALFRKWVSLIVAAGCLVVVKRVQAEESPPRTLVMMAPAARQAMLDAMRLQVDAMLAEHKVDGYPWPIVAELTLDEEKNEMVLEFDSRLEEFDVPDDTSVCHYAHIELITLLEMTNATAVLRCLFGGVRMIRRGGTSLTYGDGIRLRELLSCIQFADVLRKRIIPSSRSATLEECIDEAKST
ncbi:hypothetical protein [Luteibacter aegosomatissinici]|uniref:hypothetical protein n=1 Tax=Luteibacter aegosomatissinici TaxID=2911539 RepID=UPI001FF8050B|nr:hypothetical protein [Luteibacter aegosomatissinici]UPG95394.1 hypothetical protein L2Y97_04585 [Luteibacter aegosomatissinici]